MSVALAQDCQHTPLIEARAAEWSSQTTDWHRLNRMKRHESIAFVKEMSAGGLLTGEKKAEILLRLAQLYLDEGVDVLLSGEADTRWFEKSAKLTAQLLENYPTYDRRDEAVAIRIETLSWLGRYDEALRLAPEDDHIRADLLWGLGRFDEACAIHPQDDPPVETHPMLVDIQAVRIVLPTSLEEQVTWLRDNPDNPHADQLLHAWLRDDVRAGLAVWFAMFPLDDRQDALSAEQILELAQMPGVHFDNRLSQLRADDAVAFCEPLKRTADACVQGDPSLAIQRFPELANDGLLACLDTEIAWRTSQGKPDSWDEAAYGDLAGCVAGVR